MLHRPRTPFGPSTGRAGVRVSQEPNQMPVGGRPISRVSARRARSGLKSYSRTGIGRRASARKNLADLGQLESCLGQCWERNAKMTVERCGICEAGNRDLGVLIGSRSLPPYQLTKVTQAYTRLSPWVTHIRELPDAAAHVDALKLPNLSGTAYVRNVIAALSTPKLQDPSLPALRRTAQA